MSYAAFKMMHWATGIEHCASGFVTHSPCNSTPAEIPAINSDDLDSSEWPGERRVGPVPNLVVTAANVLEVYLVRVQEDDNKTLRASEDQRGSGGTMDGVSGAHLELVCHYRLHGNVESMAIMSVGADNHNDRRDSIMLAFQDAKITVLEYDDSSHGLRTSSMHCFEGPDWQYLKRGRESFARGPVIKADPLGRCSGVLIYGLQMIILKAAQVGQGIVGDDEPTTSGGAVSVRIESSYVINLRDLDMKHVKDFTFVHGYIEPVLVVLHEKEPTWAGRISWKHHTCMISALSINTSLKQHPMIWSASNIPHDAYKLLAVPSPIGGVLVICANTIHYYSQSISCSLCLNSFGLQPESSSEMPKSKIAVELDAANGTWLSPDVAIFSSKTGDLLLLTLIYDGRVVQRLELLRSKASVLTSGITKIGSSFFFLASRLGDSLLVQYSSGTSSLSSANMKDEIADSEGELHLAKRLRRTPSDALLEVASYEELSLYGTTNTSESAQKFFSFIVRDSFINVSPLRDFSYGLRINADPNATGTAKQSNYELMCCSGHGKNGALCVLQQSIRPGLINEVKLPGCKGIWTVYHKGSRGHVADTSKMDDDEYHAYLIISLENRTMVLETADELGEVTESVDYYVQGSTIAAGNLFGRRRVIQIFARGARILDGSYMTQEVPFGVHNSDLSSNSEAPVVVFVSIADPYVLLKMSDGSIQLLIGDPSTCTVTVSVPTVFASSTEPICACALYHDKGTEPWLRKTSTDAWLSTGITEAIDGHDGLYNDQGDIYCLVCYESGTLEFFDLQNFKCVFSVENFIYGKTHLLDKYAREPSTSFQGSKGKVSEDSNDFLKELSRDMKIVELAMHRWPGQYTRPFLFAILSDGTMLCYHAYLYEGLDGAPKFEDAVFPQKSADASNISGSRLRNLRFVRVPIDIATREEFSNVVARPRITIFKNVGGYRGLFLSGSRPAWFMVCRERVRVHPQLCDGSIVAFTVLHNLNCNHGLIYVTSEGYLKICQLPSRCNYDNYWPVQKIPLRGTPHQVTYYAESNLYPLILSFQVVRPLNQVLSSIADQDIVHMNDNDNVNSDDLQKNYTIDEFEIRILGLDKAQEQWETKATIPMQTSENALTVRVVTLFNTTTKENETLLAIGTAYVQGEDVAARGRMLLYTFVKNVDIYQNVVSEVYSKELKGAVSAIASLQGHLLVASGPKITLHKWTGTELNGIAFYDAPLHVVSLNIVKNFILLGDIHKSIYFLNWKEQGAQLSLLAKDFASLDCYATEFLIDGSTLSLVVSDDKKNIQIFYYAPKTLESWKGQKLLSRAEFHAGAHVTKFLRLQMLSTSSDGTNITPGSDKTNRFALLFSTLDGSIGCIAPLDELTFRRLQTLQRKLVDVVPHTCGLNPRSFRQFRSHGKAHRPGPDNMVDCELLSQYEMLPLDKQLEIAQQIVTTRSQILSNLSDLSLGTSFL
ncbi:cleavage and polyadenylation specificity factor subunit 1 [Curcuma longa]|uniref:cleavage and polyadenylation specificity factor subunit 1 n=2 Tax=Curcuma longa TaxID=136217 RepID=UPI003D9F9026